MHERGIDETMERIAEALNVSQQQVSKDLSGLQLSSKPSRPKGGRPKGSKLQPGRRKTTSSFQSRRDAS